MVLELLVKHLSYWCYSVSVYIVVKIVKKEYFDYDF